MTTGERIKNARKTAGLTQRELGERLGLSYQAVAQWENNLRKPKPKTLKRIAEALNVTTFSLIESTEYIDLEISEEFDAALVRMIHHMAETHGFSSPTEFYNGLLSKQISLTVLSTDLEKRLLNAYSQLNQEGKEKAVERIEELREVLKYQAQPYTYCYHYPDEQEKKTLTLTIPDPPQEE